MTRAPKSRGSEAPPPGHEADVIDSYRVPTILALSLLALGAEGALFQLFLVGTIDELAFIGLHLAVSAVLVFWAYLYRPDGHRQRLAILLPVATFAFGFMGPLGIVIITIVHKVFRRTSVRFADWYLELFPEEKDEVGRTLYDLIVSGRADAHMSTSVNSFTDVLQTGTIEQKQAVITLLTRHFRPAFAPALQLALKDINPVVRVQAATAASEIEKKFTEETLRLEQIAQERPGDLSSIIALARHFDDYAFCGLLDSQREAEYRARALENYFSAIALSPKNAEVRSAISRILVREREFREAIHYLGERLDAGEVNRSLVAWYVESLFHLGRYDEIRGILKRFAAILLVSDDDVLDDRLVIATRFWQEAMLRDERAA